ncbi:MAG: ABC transporter permease, partial [Gemmatimonadales bacterium]
MADARADSTGIGFLGWVPGVAHLRVGRVARGTWLFVCVFACVWLMAWRWERFSGAFSTPHADRWLASAFLVVLVIGLVWFSRWDIHRMRSASAEAQRGKGPWSVAMRRFRHNRLAVASVYVIALMYVVAILAPLLAPYDPAAIPDVMVNRYLPPSWSHLFGTDEFGRDLFSRAIYGARVSLSIGLLAMLIAKSIGTTYGAVAAYFGGIVDDVLMRFVDIWIAFPTFYLMLMLVGVFEANILVLVLILGLTAWPGTARFIRGEILSLKNREFTESAKAIGLPAPQIIVKHLIPSALSPVLVTAALAVAGMIGAEAGLSYLGLGIRPPTPSWGNMVAAGQDNLLHAWWVAFFPGALLTLTLISFSLLAD